MYSVRPNWLMRKLYPSAVWRIPTKEKKIFLTFDDGPVPEITPWVLSTLKQFNAKATFFCVGENVEKHPEVFRQIISEGHSIGNHTYNHLNGWKTKKENYLENIERCNRIIKSQIPSTKAQEKKLFRPPYGRIKNSQFSILNSQYSVVMWDVLSGDFDATTSEEKCLKNVLTKTREGSIVVFHDSMKAKRNLFYTLPKFLTCFFENGYQFKHLNSSDFCRQ
ncbi:MAG: polysaccharide deacetylase family protein [Bacteroidetes bacterium]|nr:polysaccharide deacetylase family protein [Bacteroidota bacterium]